VVFGIRPIEIFDKNLNNSIDPTEGNTLTTQVEMLEPMNDVVNCYLAAGRHQIVVSIDADTKADYAQPLEVVFDLEKSHLFDADTELAIYSADLNSFDAKLIDATLTNLESARKRAPGDGKRIASRCHQVCTY